MEYRCVGDVGMHSDLANKLAVVLIDSLELLVLYQINDCANEFQRFFNDIVSTVASTKTSFLIN